MNLDGLLRRQGGVLSLAQARACGLSERTVQRRVAAETWIRVHPGVYLAAGHSFTPTARVRAAALWLGPRSTVSGPAAAFWHGMLPDLRDAPIDMTLPARLHRAPRPGVRIRRRDLAVADRVIVGDLQVTASPLTVLETATRLADGTAFLDRALQRHVRFPQVLAAYRRMLGGRGSAEAGRLLMAAADRADSTAERILVRLLRAAGISGWQVGVRFGAWTLDVAFREARLAIEFDSWAWHVEHDRFVNDRRKGNALVGAGWTLLRFTWRDLTERPASVIAQIRRALGR